MEKDLQQADSNVIKVVLYGPESTGKTTLARQLAEHYNTLWIPEYARDYLQSKHDRGEGECEPDDLLPIARGQMKLENEAVKKANKILFCDTDLLVTAVYSEIYYDFIDEDLEQAAKNSDYDLYILTNIDVPWEPDDLRDKPDEREEMYDFFKSMLVHYHRPFITVRGNQQERLDKVIPILDQLIGG